MPTTRRCCGASSRATCAGATPQNHPELDRLAGYAVKYFDDFVRPTKVFRAATPEEACGACRHWPRRSLPADGSTDAEDLQNLVYEIGKTHGFTQLRDWFKALYQVLLGQDQGPRFGSFVALYGVAPTRALIARALRGELVGPGA